MSTLATTPDLPLPSFRLEPRRLYTRSSASSLPRLDTRTALPSIRELVPEHLLNSQPRTKSPSGPKTLLTSPVSSTPELQTLPGYTRAPQGQKRKRLSAEALRESEGARQVPRLCHISKASYPRRGSSPAVPRPDGYYSDFQARLASSGMYVTPGEVNNSSKLRHIVPSLTPTIRPFEQDGHSPYRLDNLTSGYHSRSPPPAHPRTTTEQPSSSYRRDYTTCPTSGHSSATTYERAPFTAMPCRMHCEGYSRFGGEKGPVGLVGGTMQRKRRGNLPKETTDRLKAWLVAHLQHPYPTEDEKQQLMRQTGLQMYQVSNWFINARRRQLPIISKSARA